MKTFVVAILLLMVTSCNNTKDITSNPAPMTDFVVGKAYVLKKAAWIREGTLLTLRSKEPANSEGILEPGTILVVRQVVVERSPEVGTYIDVLMEAITGRYAGDIFNAGAISKTLETGFTKRDPAMLEPEN